MLCTRMLFADMCPPCPEDIPGEIEPWVTIRPSERVMELQKDADDTVLYKACTIACGYLVSTVVKTGVRLFLYECYGCFTSEEYDAIYSKVCTMPFMGELPGRLYVYLRLHHRADVAGFYRFMCKDISRAVLSAAACEAEKIIDLNEQQEIIQTLRCFSALWGRSAGKVELRALAGRVQIKRVVPPALSGYEGYSIDEADLIAELVAINPDVIEIYNREEFQRSDVSPIIQAVFEGRIQYR